MANVTIVALEPFGTAVAGYFSLLFSEDSLQVLRSTDELSELHYPTSSVLVYATAAEDFEISETVERFASHENTSFIPLIFDGTRLQVGPILVPGLHGCLQCYKLRTVQQESRAGFKEALASSYRSGHTQRPKGYLDCFAAMGASRLRELLTLLAVKPEEANGLIWSLNVFDGTVEMGRLEGIHDCPQCSSPHQNADEQTYLRLRRALSLQSLEHC